MVRRVAASACGLVLLVAAVGCAEPNLPDQTLPSYPPLVIEPPSAALALGDIQTFRASGGNPRIILWTACGPTQYALMLPLGIDPRGQRVGSLSVSGDRVQLIGDRPGRCTLIVTSAGQLAYAAIEVRGD